MKSGSIWIPQKFIEGYFQLTGPERDVLAALSSFRNKHTGLAFPKQEVIQTMTGHSLRTIARALRRLEARKAIRYHGGGFRSRATEYHLFGPGKNGPCTSCEKRKPRGGRKPKEKVATQMAANEAEKGCQA